MCIRCVCPCYELFLVFFQILYLRIGLGCAYVHSFVSSFMCMLQHMACLCLVRAWSDVYKRASPSGKWSMVNKVLFKQKHAKCKRKSALVHCVGPIWHQCIPNPSASPQLLFYWKKKQQQSKWVENECVINGYMLLTIQAFPDGTQTICERQSVKVTCF